MRPRFQKRYRLLLYRQKDKYTGRSVMKEIAYSCEFYSLSLAACLLEISAAEQAQQPSQRIASLTKAALLVPVIWINYRSHGDDENRQKSSQGSWWYQPFKTSWRIDWVLVAVCWGGRQSISLPYLYLKRWKCVSCYIGYSLNSSHYACHSFVPNHSKTYEKYCDISTKAYIS